ncbi:MAG: hypothetical protein H0T42_01845 [Deltaproteobacteria bacterium]|nr:hypothetical protein [Deltaproteobacteria bacterium]
MQPAAHPVSDAPSAILGTPAGDVVANGHAAYAPHLAATVVSPSPVVAIANPYHDESRPILPQRPTGRMQTEPNRSIWRNWPVIVIVLAVLAIGTAVVLMLWPPARSARAGSKLPPPPTPERMDTNPMAPRDPGAGIPQPQGGADPWSNRNGVPPVPPPDDPDDTIDPDDLLKDPFANPRGGLGGGGGGGALGGNPFGSMGGGSALVFAMVQRACDRMKQCPSSSAADMCKVMEQSLGQFPIPAPPASCVAAQRCLSQIDRLDLCGSSANPLGGGGLVEVTMLLSTAQDCIDAARC